MTAAGGAVGGETGSAVGGDGEPKLRLEGVQKHFPATESLVGRLLARGQAEPVRAVDGVTLSVARGEALGLAGESGCGKTTLGKTILRLHDPTAGRIVFDGRDVTDAEGTDLQAFRQEAQMIHQNPYESLNPRFTVYRWVKEPLDVHGVGTAEERDARVYEMLERTGLDPPSAYAGKRPGQLSGGERQRVGIARALALQPSFLLADEPVSMLDVSIRASILELFADLRVALGLTAVYISHDLSMLRHVCDRIAIMYLGRIVEVGPADQVIDAPQHPYTEALVQAIPRIDPDHRFERVDLPGEVPDPTQVPSGCRFNPRCPYAMDECTCDEPALYEPTPGHRSRCILHDEAVRERTDVDFPS